MNKKFLIVLLFGFAVLPVHAQNYDLSSFKDFDQLAKVNPAFTGVLQKLRLLANNRGADLNIGFEGRIFKTDHYLGGGFNQVSIGSVRRQTLYASYNKDFELKNKALFKIALQGDYNQKSFFRKEGETAFDFVDFDGISYRYDSISADDFSAGRNYADIGLGFGYLGKRLVLGGNVKHLNRAKYSINTTDERRMPFEASAQLCGFFGIGKITMIPVGVFSVQGDDIFYNIGAGINYLEYTVTGKLQRSDDQELLDIGLNYRKGRIFASVGYAADLNSSDGIDFSNINLTLNTSLRKIKNPDTEIIKYLANMY